MENFCFVAKEAFEASEGSDDGRSARAVAADHRDGVSSTRSGGEDSLVGGRVEGKDAVVFEQDDGLTSGFESGGFVFGGVDDVLCFFGIGEGVVEEAELEFDAQDVRHALVDELLTDASFGDHFAKGKDEFLGVLEVGADVEAGGDGIDDGGFEVGRSLVLFCETAHRSTVGNDVTFEAIGVAEKFGEKVGAAGDGDAVVGVVGTHRSPGLGLFDHFLEGVHQDLVHIAEGNLGIGAGFAIASPVGGAVGGEVFDGGSDSLGLDAEALLLAELADEEGGFAVAFDGAAPAWVAYDIEDRGVNVRIAERFAFSSGDFANAAHKVFIPSGTDSDLSGEVAGVAVADAADAFVGEVDGDAETGFLDEPTLNGIE